LDKFNVFLEEVLGRKYGLNISKLTKMQTMKVNKDISSKEYVDDNRTFFCSELVAKAFKIIGVLKDDGQSSTQFLPGHFSSKGDQSLKLCDGVKIGPDMKYIAEL